jgi:hypothetical protein
MPPVHVLPHVLRAGGIPAGLGVLLGLILGWPREDAVVTPPFGSAGSGPLEVGPTYHNAIGGSDLALGSAVGSMLFLVIVLALVGLAIGYVLVVAGVVKKDELGME